MIAVCPDDLGDLAVDNEGAVCLRCQRKFDRDGDILELLPQETLAAHSPEKEQLEAYTASFSQRRDRDWYQPLRTALSFLGNGYLYFWAARAVELGSKGKVLDILDAACGDAIQRAVLSPRHNYAGVDFSTRSLRRAARIRPGRYYRADLRHLPFPNATFDVAICLQALQYLDQPQAALVQLARVLRPGGLLLLSVPNGKAFKYRRFGIPSIQLQRFDRNPIVAMLAPHFEVAELLCRGFWLPASRFSVHLPGIYHERWGLSWTVVAEKRGVSRS